MKKRQTKRHPEWYAPLAEKALKKAIAKLIALRCRAGGSLAIWRDGKVVHVPAVELAQTKSRRQRTA